MRQITSSNPTVTLERKDEHKHLHSLATSFRIKRSKNVQELIKRLKNYSAAQIFHAICSGGTNAGNLLLDVAGGVFTMMKE